MNASFPEFKKNSAKINHINLIVFFSEIVNESLYTVVFISIYFITSGRTFEHIFEFKASSFSILYFMYCYAFHFINTLNGCYKLLLA